MLTFPPTDQFAEPPFRDRVQIALAIADHTILQSLLTDCTPPLASPHRIGSIHSKIGIPLATTKAIDGLIQFEDIQCVLVESPQALEQCVADYTHRNGNERGYLDLTRCEAETRDLGLITTLAQAIARLSQAGFSSQQIHIILNLPQEAWHKTWWYSTDPDGQFTVPFLRLMRSHHYLDGRIAIQYKDFFAHDKPACFKSQQQQIVVEIFSESKGFKKTLEKINYARQELNTERALLIGDRFSELEAQGFISQGISLFAAQEVLRPAQADCALCATACPLQGRVNSPVTSCKDFCLDLGEGV
jgi:hypothetical protein